MSANFRALLLNKFNENKKWCVSFPTEGAACELFFASTAEELLPVSIYHCSKHAETRARDIHIFEVILKENGELLLNEVSPEELEATEKN